MSLRVWLPLTKDLRNQGLDDVTVTNNGATFNSAGKLGGCYSLDSTSINIGKPLPSPCTAFTVVGWVNLLNGFTVNNGFHLLSFGQAYGRVCVSKDGAALQTLIPSNAGGTTGSPCPSNMVNTAITAGTWHHYIVTYDAGLIKIYIDGVLDKEYNTGISSFTYTNNIIIGTFGAESCKGLLNDYRLYDHALSQMEVKEIAKGLVLHYPLADAYVEATTNLATINGPGGWNNSGESTRATNDSFYTNPPCSDCPVYSIKQTAAGNSAITFSSVNATNANIKGQQVSCSVWVYLKNTQSSNVVYLRSTVNDNKTGNNITNLAYNGSTDPRTWPLNKWIRITGTGTVDSNETSVYFCTYTGLLNEERAFNGWQIELKDHVTPYVEPQTSRGTGVIYDTSGYCHNGTVVGTLETSSDTPKYNVSTKFNGSNTCIYLNNFVLGNEWSYGMWFYHPTRDGTWTIITILNNTGSDSDTQFSFWYNNNENRFQSTANTQYNSSIPAPTKDAWHHFFATFDGNILTTYIDGVIVNTKTITAELTQKPHLTIGGRRSGENSWDYYWKGKMSDYRVYCTALSADDVKSLYNNSAYIDNQGNLYGAVYEEV